MGGLTNHDEAKQGRWKKCGSVWQICACLIFLFGIIYRGPWFMTFQTHVVSCLLLRAVSNGSGCASAKDECNFGVNQGLL